MHWRRVNWYRSPARVRLRASSGSLLGERTVMNPCWLSCRGWPSTPQPALAAVLDVLGALHGNGFAFCALDSTPARRGTEEFPLPYGFVAFNEWSSNGLSWLILRSIPCHPPDLE